LCSSLGLEVKEKLLTEDSTTPDYTTSDRKVCCKYSYAPPTSSTWVREVSCGAGQSAGDCCGTQNGTIYNWSVVGVADGACTSSENCTRVTAGGTAACAFVIAIPTDPTDVVGTLVGVGVGVVAGVTYLCCSARVLDLPITVSLPDVLPRTGDRDCPACPACPPNPPPMFHKGPPAGHAHWPCTGDHTHIQYYEPGQNPTTCQCFCTLKKVEPPICH